MDVTVCKVLENEALVLDVKIVQTCGIHSIMMKTLEFYRLIINQMQ